MTWVSLCPDAGMNIGMLIWPVDRFTFPTFHHLVAISFASTIRSLRCIRFIRSFDLSGAACSPLARASTGVA